jgi:formate dehydrogenase maturation protein FdhE
MMNIDEEEKDIRVCPVCGKEVERSNMLFTHDCHGIPFRLVCSRCWEKLMSKGYDGEYYTEADEQIEPDY